MTLPLYPPTAWDATMYHFALAKMYVLQHQISFTSDIRFAAWPQTNKMLFSLMLLFYDDIAAQLVQFLMLILVVCCLYVWGRKAFSKETAILSVALWLSNPLVIWLGASGYIDVGLTLFVTMGIYAFVKWVDSNNIRWLAISGCFCGLGAGTKYTGLVYFGILWMLIILKSREFKLKNIFNNLFIFTAFCFAIASIWYIRSYVFTNNPVFPFFSNIFGYGLYDQQDLKGIYDDLIYAHGTARSVLSFLELPWNLAFHQNVFLMEAPISPILPLIMPFFIVWGLIVRKARLIAQIVLIFIIAWFCSTQILRYLVPILPVLSLGISVLFSSCYERLKSIRVLGNNITNTLVLLFIFIIMISPGPLYAMYKISSYGKPPFTEEQKQAYLKQHLMGYSAIEFLNHNKGSEYTLYALFAENLAYFADGKFKGDWLGPDRYSKIVDFGDILKIKNGIDLFNILREMNVNYLLVTQNRRNVILPDDDFFKQHFKLVYARPYILLYELSQEPLYLKQGPEILSNPSFEDLDDTSFPKKWSVFNKPIIDSTGKNSNNGLVGIRVDWVDSDNGLYQDVSVKSDIIYQLSCYARSNDQGQKMRLQVNWLNQNKEFLKQLDIQLFNVSEEWNNYLTFLSVPKGAAYAKIYVRSDPLSSVWFDDFSFKKIDYELR